MARLAPLHVILLAQSLSAGSELLGQRVMLRCHAQSSVRMLISMSVYCSLQATVVLGAIELFLPSLSGGQGPLSMWALLARFPGLWLNAAVNGIYLLSITVLLREALGPLYVVFAFLSAAVLLGALGGGTQAAATWAAALLGAFGAALVLWPRDSPMCAPRWTWRVLRAAVLGDSGDGAGRALPGSAGERRSRRASGAAAGEGESDPLATGGPGDAPDAVTLHSGEAAEGAPPDQTGPTVAGEDSAAALPAPPPTLLARLSAALAAGAALRHASVAAAFVALALSAATGISLATHYQRVAGLNGFGYTAIDQVLLPLAALPLAAALDRSRRLRAWAGEPPWSASQPLSPSFGASLWRAAGEVFAAPLPGAPDAGSSGGEPAASGRQAGWAGRHVPPLLALLARSPWPFVFTLVPYHGLEFVRSFLLFFLVTTFDLDATYLQMTLVRVVLCWVATLLSCTLLREWVGVPRADVERALSPVSLASTCAGSALMVAAVALLRA